MSHITIENNIDLVLKSCEIIIEHNLNRPIYLRILDEIFDLVSYRKGDITIDSLNNAQNRLSYNATSISSNPLKGRNKTTPTWLEFQSCRKGLGGLANP
jgi:hypothetical protein